MPIQLTKVAYTTSASARGGRSGHVKSADGLVEFDLAQPGTTPEPAVNPETLFAAGYAACFQGALANRAKTKGIDTSDSTVTAHVSFGSSEDGGFGLAVDLEVTGVPAALPATVGHAGYRIVQEGLTNVLRHSTAPQAQVRVEVDDCAVVIEVVDDGHKRATTSLAGGHGVRGMQERAAALGGTCEAGMVNGAGWRVRARIPVGEKGP